MVSGFKRTHTFVGALIQIRTGDLILTKDALYHLSYKSVLGKGKKYKPAHSSLLSFHLGKSRFGKVL